MKSDPRERFAGTARDATREPQSCASRNSVILVIPANARPPGAVQAVATGLAVRASTE